MKRPASLQLPGQPVQLGGKEFAPAEKVGQSEESILREVIMGLKSQVLYPPLPSLWLTVRTNFSTVCRTGVTQCNGTSIDLRSGTSAMGASLACKEACTASSDAFAALMINQCSLLGCVCN